MKPSLVFATMLGLVASRRAASEERAVHVDTESVDEMVNERLQRKIKELEDQLQAEKQSQRMIEERHQRKMQELEDQLQGERAARAACDCEDYGHASGGSATVVEHAAGDVANTSLLEASATTCAKAKDMLAIAMARFAARPNKPTLIEEIKTRVPQSKSCSIGDLRCRGGYIEKAPYEAARRFLRDGTTTSD